MIILSDSIHKNYKKYCLHSVALDEHQETFTVWQVPFKGGFYLLDTDFDKIDLMSRKVETFKHENGFCFINFG